MKKVLIIQNKFIGDVLVASLLADNLKQVTADLEIHFLCYAPALGVLEGNPNIDRVITFDDKELKNVSNLWALSRKLRDENYDWLFDTYAKLQSRFITLHSTATLRSSYNKPFFRHLYTHTYFKRNYFESGAFCSAVDNRLRILNAVVDDYTQLPQLRPNIYLSQEEIKNARNQMSDAGITFNRPVVMVGILGSSLQKSWPIAYMTSLVSTLQSKLDVDILLNYMPRQQSIAQEVINELPSKDRIYLDVLGQGIRAFSAILKNCDFLVANEGGAVNISKALDVPSYCIFSPHKFRNEWGCYENDPKFDSFHIHDIDNRALYDFTVRGLMKDPQPLYKKMYPNLVIPKVLDFLIGRGVESIQGYSPSSLEHVFKMPVPVSVVVITKNEERNIQRFLNDFSFADEVVVVDSHSTDRTQEIACQHKRVKFIKRVFDNFSAQKNFAIEQAINEWILFFDTDESPSVALLEEIKAVLSTKNPLDAYFVKRKFFLRDKAIKYSGYQNDKAIRLFRKEKSRYDANKLVHETIVCSGTVGMLKNHLNHYSFSSNAKFKKKLASYSKLKAKMLYKKGVKPSWFMRMVKPAFRFLHHYIFLYGFLDGKEGIRLAKMHAYSVELRYWYLKQLYREDKD